MINNTHLSAFAVERRHNDSFSKEILILVCSRKRIPKPTGAQSLPNSREPVLSPCLPASSRPAAHTAAAGTTARPLIPPRIARTSVQSDAAICAPRYSHTRGRGGAGSGASSAADRRQPQRHAGGSERGRRRAGSPATYRRSSLLRAVRAASEGAR